MQASAPWPAGTVAVAEPVCRICGVPSGAACRWSNSIIVSPRPLAAVCPLCRGRAPSVPAQRVTPRAPVMLRISSAKTLEPGMASAPVACASRKSISPASVTSSTLVRPASAVTVQRCVRSISPNSRPVLQAQAMSGLSEAAGPVNEERAGAGSEATRVVEVSNDEALGASALGQRPPSTGQSSWRTQVADSKTRSQSAASTTELPSRELKSTALESAVLLSEFGKTLEQANLLLRQTNDSDIPAHPGQESPVGASAAGPLPPPHSAVPSTRLMAAAPQLAPNRTSPLSPRRAFEAPACNSLRWQQPPRQSPGCETRSRTAPDLPDPDLAAATEASATAPPSTNPATPAIKFPEPNLSAVGTLGTTAQNPMIASAPTLLCDPCTPTSDVATAPLWDPVSTVCAPPGQLSNSQDVLPCAASSRSSPFCIQGKMTNLPSCRSPSRPRSPKHDELYEDAAARRERHQDRLGEQMRRQQRNEAEEQMRWQLEKERWQASYKGPQDLRSHLERELELLQKRRSRQHEFQVEQLAREKEEMQECTFWPNTSRSKLSYEAIRSGSRSRNSINGINASSSSVSMRTESRRGGSRSSSRGSPDERIEELLALHEKQVLVLSRLSQICMGQGGNSARCTANSSLSGLEEVKLYIQQLRQVHELERLDMQVLELPKRRQQTLTGLGYKFGLAKDLRSKLPSPHVPGTNRQTVCAASFIVNV
ncbi:unnamed protein product [Symbiodinium sp. CCMP2456]|nr:unnamed protein product [Symbiodinium sp. CCMP2456]